MATHSSVLAWRIQGRWSLVGCRLWGHTESDTTEVTQQQQQPNQSIRLSRTRIVNCFVHYCTPALRNMPSTRVLCLVAQSYLTVCDPMECSPPGSSSVHEDSPGNNTGVGCHALLQGIFPTLGSNPDLPRCRQILYRLSHQGSPSTLESQSNLYLSTSVKTSQVFPQSKTIPEILMKLYS